MQHEMYSSAFTLKLNVRVAKKKLHTRTKCEPKCIERVCANVPMCQSLQKYGVQSMVLIFILPWKFIHGKVISEPIKSIKSRVYLSVGFRTHFIGLQNFTAQLFMTA